MTGAIWLISKVKRGTAFAAVFGWSAVVVLVRVALPQRFPGWLYPAKLGAALEDP
jgi:hypothetical protein